MLDEKTAMEAVCFLCLNETNKRGDDLCNVVDSPTIFNIFDIQRRRTIDYTVSSFQDRFAVAVNLDRLAGKGVPSFDVEIGRGDDAADKDLGFGVKMPTSTTQTPHRVWSLGAEFDSATDRAVRDSDNFIKDQDRIAEDAQFDQVFDKVMAMGSRVLAVDLNGVGLVESDTKGIKPRVGYRKTFCRFGLGQIGLSVSDLGGVEKIIIKRFPVTAMRTTDKTYGQVYIINC